MADKKAIYTIEVEGTDALQAASDALAKYKATQDSINKKVNVKVGIKAANKDAIDAENALDKLKKKHDADRLNAYKRAASVVNKAYDVTAKSLKLIIGSSLAGVGILGKISSSASNERKEVQGQGTDAGSLAALKVQLGSVLDDVSGTLQKLNTHAGDITDVSIQILTGISKESFTRLSATEKMSAFVLAAKEKIDKLDPKLLHSKEVLHANGLGDLSDEEINRLKVTRKEEIQQILASIATSKTALNIEDEKLKRLQQIEKEFDATFVKLKHGFEEAVVELTKSSTAQAAFNAILEQIDKGSKYLASPEFTQDMTKLRKSFNDLLDTVDKVIHPFDTLIKKLDFFSSDVESRPDSPHQVERQAAVSGLVDSAKTFAQDTIKSASSYYEKAKSFVLSKEDAPHVISEGQHIPVNKSVTVKKKGRHNEEDSGNLGVFSKLSALIRSGEGTYDAINHGTKKGALAPNYNSGIENLTVDEVLAKQRAHEQIGGHRNSNAAFATGAYQVIPDTMRKVLPLTTVKGTDKFDKSTQDKLFLQFLANHKHVVNYLENKGSIEDAIGHSLKAKNGNNTGQAGTLSGTWASVATTAGRSAYGSGNKSSHTIEQEKQVLMQLKEALNGRTVKEAINSAMSNKQQQPNVNVRISNQTGSGLQTNAL